MSTNTGNSKITVSTITQDGRIEDETCDSKSWSWKLNADGVLELTLPGHLQFWAPGGANIVKAIEAGLDLMLVDGDKLIIRLENFEATRHAQVHLSLVTGPKDEFPGVIYVTAEAGDDTRVCVGEVCMISHSDEVQ